jgi:predicted nucleotide-binding protein (sugar kinase/HSP70/actin superfamily)
MIFAGQEVSVAIGAALGIAIPGTVLVVKLLPLFASRITGGERAAPSKRGHWECPGVATLEEHLGHYMTNFQNNQLSPLLNRQADILERMEGGFEQMKQILQTNTTILEKFIALQEQRDRFLEKLREAQKNG